MTPAAVSASHALDAEFAALHRRERLQREHERELDRREADLAARADVLRRVTAELDDAWAEVVARMQLLCAAERLVTGEQRPC